MAASDEYTRALRFAGPIFARVLAARAKHAHCRPEDLATAEVSDYQDAILHGIRDALRQGHTAPEQRPDVFDGDTVRPPAPVRQGAPTGVYTGTADLDPAPTGRTHRGFPLPIPPPPAGGPPFDDVHERKTPVRRMLRRP